MNPTTPTSPHLLFRALALLALFALPLYADGSNPKEEVAASDFGFNTDDATEALQKAIDSGAARVVVDKQDSPWIVSKTIRLASNQEIVFEGGVGVMAKKGAFRGGGDCLFVARDVANLTLRGKATLQMRKEDYLKPPYKKAEWRHALSLRGCTNVKVLGLTLKESGGDGVYLGIGPGGTTNKDIVIRDVVCDGNNRQGISVITAENLLIENTVLKNTGGTPPAAGIDFEPNRPGERLVNCIMRNCVSEGNAYAGYDFYLRFMDETSEPVTVRIENCVSRNNGGPSAALGMFTRHEGGCLKGKIEFVDCRFEGDEGGGIDIQDNDVDGCRLVFKDCLIRDVGMKEEKKETAPILIRSRTLVPRGFGNISFDDVTVVDSRDRPALDFAAISPTMSLEKVDGTIVRKSKDRTETFELTEALLDEWFPMRKVARNLQSRDWKWTKPAAGGRSTDAASFPRLRGPFRLAAFVEEGDKPAIRFTARQIGQSRVGPYSFVVEGPGGNRVKSYLRKNASGESELTFDVPVTGVYTIKCTPKSNGFSVRVVAATVPVSLFPGNSSLGMIYSPTTLYFTVPAGTRCFAVGLAGSGSERVKATVLNAKGKVVKTQDDISKPTALVVEPEIPPQADALWRLVLQKPTTGVLEDVSVVLTGVPPMLAPTPEMLLAPEAED